MRNGAMTGISRRTRYRKTEGIHTWLCAPGRLFLCLKKGRFSRDPSVPIRPEESPTLKVEY